MNLIRAFTQGGFADLRQVHEWNRGFVTNAANARYEALAGQIDRAMRFMAACGADFEALKAVDFYSCHEALLLDYERALTRIDSRTGLPYDVSAHFVWVGERTRKLDGAHLDFAARIHNPIGVKLSAKTSPDDALALIDKLDPDRTPGPADLHHPDGSGHHPRGPPRAGAEGHGERRAGHLDLRSHARQHVRVAQRLQDPPLRRRDRRGAWLLRGAPRARHGARAGCTSSSPATT